MSLAEELLADLDEAEDEMDEDFEVKKEEEDAIEEVTDAPIPNLGAYEHVTDVAKLTQSEKYRKLIGELHELLDMKDVPPLRYPIELDPQYQLVVKLSQLAADIDQEINVIHKFVRDKYEKRFPELETLVPMHLDYINTVKLLGNDIQTKGQNKELLGAILPPATCIVVSVTASTSQGKPLEPDQLEKIIDACKMAQDLHEERMKMHQFVEQRMSLIAPNLCTIVGAGTAAMLVSQAGGLSPLARMPSSNVLVLGKQKKTLSGFSSSAILPHSGFIFFHPLVQTLPPDIRNKVARTIANKCTLAARVDSLHESPDGEIGRGLMDQISQKIEKMLEPPPTKSTKALPKPLDKASKKRGGRRARKFKESMGMSDFRRKANRMNFGELQEDVMQTDIGFTLGQLKSDSLKGGGRLRAGVVDNKTRAKMSQKLTKVVQKHNQAAGGVTAVRAKLSGTKTIGGTVSSVAFTPVQGIEIINPTAHQLKPAPSTSSYFNSTTNFMKVQTPLPK